MSEELIRMIRESRDDEQSDIDKYERMAVLAENEGCIKAAGVLRDIRHDEMTHRELLGNML